MRNGKKIIIPIIVICFLLLISGTIFAYVYISTDLLKSDRQLFVEYLTQIIAEDGFIEKQIQDFNQKKLQNPYENSGMITIETQYPEELGDTEIIEKVNDLSIKFSGKTDVVNQKVEQNIDVDYGNNIIFPISYRQDNNKFGLQFKELSKQYISIRNENLKQLAEKLGAEEVSNIPDTLTINEGIQFSNEEKNQLIKIYGDVLLSELEDERFSTQKTENGESYTLELNSEQIKNLIIKILEATKQKTLIIDKINEMILEQNPEAEKIDVSIIDDLIKELNSEKKSNNLTNIIDKTDDIIEGINTQDIANIPNFKLTLVQSNKKLNQIIIESGQSKIKIIKSNIDGKVNYYIDFDVTQTTESGSIFEEKTSETEQLKVYFNVQYTGLQDLNNVQENYGVGYDLTSDGESMKCDYKISNNTQFKESVSIQQLDENIAVFLNDHTKEQVSNFLSQVGTKLGEINKKQMESLGLKEDENPLLYTNPITMLGYMVYKEANETIEKIDLSEVEKQFFNDNFRKYEGKKRGAEINALITTVQVSNLQYPDRVVKLTLNGNEINDRVEMTKMYQVEAIYNDNGLITEMRVTTQN